MIKKLNNEFKDYMKDTYKYKCTQAECKEEKEFTKEELKEHLSKQCEVKELNCKFCEQVYKRSDFVNSETHNCAKLVKDQLIEKNNELDAKTKEFNILTRDSEAKDLKIKKGEEAREKL